METAGLISMGGYIPAKAVADKKHKQLVDFLQNETLLHSEYIDAIEKYGRLPGSIETNYDGWESRPWFEKWVQALPPHKQQDPFQGTKERRRVPFDPVSIRESVTPHPMLSSDAETLAGALALFNGGIHANEIDVVLCNSLVPDRNAPLNASLIQHKLGLRNAGAYTVDTCCASFITMLELAAGLVRSGIKKTVLVVASALDSHINDKSTYYSVDTGDAAVAGVVSQVEEGYGYRASHATSHGNRHAAITLQSRRPELLTGTSHGPTYEQVFVTLYDQALCKEIAANAQHDMVEVVSKALTKAHLSIANIDFLVTHQPVAWAAHAWRESLNVPPEKFYESFERYGNIACCSAAMNFFEALEKRLIAVGDTVVMASSGIGENHIALLERVAPKLIRSVCG
jgi:3-oxoacyl-[acyl-carrier-protein] synthase-3